MGATNSSGVRCRGRSRALGLRYAAAVVLALALLVLSAQTALAATGSIAGQVTAAATHQPIEGIEVCAVTSAFGSEDEASESEEGPELGSEQYGCTKTAAGGEYTISGLGAGTFVVAFGNPLKGSLNYVTQYYKGKSMLKEATDVSVGAGATTREIDAELQEGAEVSGVLTNAAGGAGIEGALVCVGPAKGSPPRELVCTLSGAGGAYSIVGIESGSVVILAFASEFSIGFYGGGATLAEATPVALAVKEDRGGLNIALQAAPTGASGGSGSTPAGSSGGSSAPPLSAAGGAALGQTAPASGAGLANSSIDQGGRSSVLVRLTCNSARKCRGKLALSAARSIMRKGRRVREMVRIGTARFTAKAGHTFVVAVVLDHAGKALLHAARGPLTARLRITQSTPKPTRTSLRRVLVLARRSANPRKPVARAGH